ncbi:MAG: hypothetical protein ACI399_03465 [Candidatus Cryptobacteroides sp.]
MRFPDSAQEDGRSSLIRAVERSRGSGMSGRDYASLHPVFEIAFLAENFAHEKPALWDADHIVSHYSFIEKRTGETPNPTIFIILAEIGRFNKAKEECLSTRDRLFYWFRHANEFKEKPEWLDDPETVAECTGLTLSLD